MTELKRLNIRITPEMHEWLAKSADSRGISMNAMVIMALETYIQQQTMMPLLPEMLKQIEKMDEWAKEKK